MGKVAKELPYFKFFIGDWINGDITLETDELQGIFINICAYYWSKDCDLSLINLKKKFRMREEKIDQLIESHIIKIKSGEVKINFLIEQWKSKELQVITNRINGQKGGRPAKEETEEKPNGLNLANPNESETITETKAKDNPNETNIDKIREDNIKRGICLRILTDFKFNEIKNFDKLRKISEFINQIYFNNGQDYFLEQYNAYWIWKNKSGEKTQSLNTFLEGGWDKENWTEKSGGKTILYNGQQVKNESNNPNIFGV